jgi:HD-like signal output (HDOD) protein
MTNDRLQKKIEKITNLPTLPEIVPEIMRIINNPGSSSGDVANAISHDPALSTRILRLANSAFYGIPRSIASINNAIVILGFKVVGTIVVSLSVFDMFPSDKKNDLFNRRAFWRHCTGCGLLCRFLAEKISASFPFDAEEAFCAGLLHDIGKVVMEQYMHDDFHKALLFAKKNHLPQYNAEKETLKYTHADVAGWLTSNWDLPLHLQLPMIFHHEPVSAKSCNAMVNLCHIADRLCYDLKLYVDEAYSPPQLDKTAQTRLCLSDDDIEQVKTRLADELDKVDLFCSIAS